MTHCFWKSKESRLPRTSMSHLRHQKRSLMSEFAVRKLEEPQQSQVLQSNLAAPFINTEVKLYMTPFISHWLCLLKGHIDSNVQIPPGHLGGGGLCPNTQAVMYCAVISWCRLTIWRQPWMWPPFFSDFQLAPSTQTFLASKFYILKLMKCTVSVIKMSLGEKTPLH